MQNSKMNQSKWMWWATNFVIVAFSPVSAIAQLKLCGQKAGLPGTGYIFILNETKYECDIWKMENMKN